MEEEKKIEETTAKEEPKQETAPDYIKVIEDLKKNTVSKDDYDKVLRDNKQLLDSLVNNRPIEQAKPQPTSEEVDKHIDELRDKIFNTEMNNLDYVKTALELRKSIIDRDGAENDPFVGRGHKLTPTEEDYEAAERVANVFQECVDKSEGQSDLFTAQLQNHTIDVKIPNKKAPKKAYQY